MLRSYKISECTLSALIFLVSLMWHETIFFSGLDELPRSYVSSLSLNMRLRDYLSLPLYPSYLSFSSDANRQAKLIPLLLCQIMRLILQHSNTL